MSLRGVLVVAALGIALALGGCSTYPDEFALEPMIIYDLAVTGVGEHEATITWKTSKKGDSVVYYRRVTSVEDLVRSDTQVLDHSMALTNLFPSSEYLCRVLSSNAEGYHDEWQDVLVRTLPWPPVSPPPSGI